MTTVLNLVVVLVICIAILSLLNPGRRRRR